MRATCEGIQKQLGMTGLTVPAQRKEALPEEEKRKKKATPLTVTFTTTNHGGNNIY